jgi:NPCBM/NEW2 domain/Legume lectin domain/Bacterial lectin
MNTLPVLCGFASAYFRAFSMAMVVVWASFSLRAATIQLIDDKPAVETASLSGFGGGTGWKVNSKDNPSPPFPSSNVLLLTNSNSDEARSAFYEKPMPVVAGGSGFTVLFTYTPSGDKWADGAAFVLHNDPRGASALGGYRGALGVGTETDGIPIASSVEFEINIWGKPGIAWVSNGSTGPYDATGSVNVGSGNPIDVTLTYAPATTTLSVKLVDQVTKTTYSSSYKTLNVTNILGGSTAYVGFTGGGHRATQKISNFSYSVAGATLAKADDKPSAEPFKLSGFGGGTGWKTNGNGSSSASFPSPGVLRLTDNNAKDVSSAFYEKPVPIVAGASGFTASFTYTASGNKEADGVAFVLQNDSRGASALGGDGKALGVGSEKGVTAVAPSVEFEIKLWRGQGIAWMSNGDPGTYASTAPVNVASGDPIEATLSYDPPKATLSVKLVDKTTKAIFSTSYKTFDLTKVLESPTAFIGFTGSCGVTTSIQQVANFSYSVGAAPLSAATAAADRIVGFESGSFLVKPPIEGAVEKKVSLADIVSVILDEKDRAALGASAKTDRSGNSVVSQKTGARWRVELSPADHVTASIINWTDGQVTLNFDSLKTTTLRVPVERVRAIWSTNAAKTKQAQDLNIAADSQDVAFVESDSKVKSVTGVADGLDGEFLKFKYEGAERKIKLDRLVGVLLAQRELPTEKLLYENFALASGDVVSGRIEALEGGIFRVAPLWTAVGADERGVFSLPLAALARIEITGGRVAWVGDLKPVTVSQVPYFDRLMPYRVNQSLTGGPLALADGIAARGIAVHSKCVLTYDIGGGFERFRTKLGFQQPEGKIGRAAVRVLGDGKVLWQDSDLKGDTAPSLLDLNVAAVKTLILEVGYGKNQDVAGRVVWGDARLIKSAAK